MAGERSLRNHILVISHDVVERQMAGPGIRYVELATVLGREFEVTLATPNLSTLGSDRFRIRPYHDWASLVALTEGVQAIFSSGFTVQQFPHLVSVGIPLAVDLYDPFPAENLVLFANREPAEQQHSYEFSMQVLDAMYAAGDFFVCDHERQRDWWLGILHAGGRVTPEAVADDPTLRRLIDNVPFGLPSRPFEAKGEGPKATMPELADSRLILWGGGIWDWLDPLTVIEAMPAVLEREPRARLLFPGARHPNPGTIDMAMRRRAVDVATHLNLLNQSVLFGDWVPYETWPAYLSDADVAVSLHFETLETHVAAVRSRTLSYIWAGLPMVVTEGDAASELVREHGLGKVVGYKDVAGVAEAILELLAAGKAPYRDRFEALAPQLTWERAAEPLMAFCRNPYVAPGEKKRSPMVPDANVLLMREQEQIEQLQARVRAYEQGRFIRAMRRVDQLKQKLHSFLAK